MLATIRRTIRRTMRAVWSAVPVSPIAPPATDPATPRVRLPMEDCKRERNRAWRVSPNTVDPRPEILPCWTNARSICGVNGWRRASATSCASCARSWAGIASNSLRASAIRLARLPPISAVRCEKVRKARWVPPAPSKSPMTSATTSEPRKIAAGASRLLSRVSFACSPRPSSINTFNIRPIETPHCSDAPTAAAPERKTNGAQHQPWRRWRPRIRRQKALPELHRRN